MERTGGEGGNSQEKGAHKIDFFQGPSLEGGEVLLVGPCEEEDDKREAADGATVAPFCLASWRSGKSGRRATNLIQNTHRQLVYWVRMPPRTGPKTPDEAITTPIIMAMYFCIRSGVISGSMIMQTL